MLLVGVEAAGGFAAEPARRDVFFEQRASAIFRIAEAFLENAEDVEADIEADEIGELERAHGMVHAELHDSVHGFGGGDAFHDAIGGFIDERHEDAVTDKAGSVIHGDGLFFELFGELHGGLERGVAGFEGADDFDEDHDRDRIHEVHADKAVRTIRERGEGGDGDRRSVAGEDHAGPHDAVGILEHDALDFEFFGDGLNDEIGGGNGGDRGDGLEAGENRGAVGPWRRRRGRRRF